MGGRFLLHEPLPLQVRAWISTGYEFNLLPVSVHETEW
jgi:hypothetical protein